MTGSYCLENHQTCSKLHHLYNTCLKCPPPERTKISDVDEPRWRIKNEWTVWITLFVERACGWRHGASVYVLVFVRDADISSIYDVTYCTLDVVGNNDFQSFCIYSLINYNAHLSTASTYFRWSGQFLHSTVNCSLKSVHIWPTWNIK